MATLKMTIIFSLNVNGQGKCGKCGEIRKATDRVGSCKEFICSLLDAKEDGEKKHGEEAMMILWGIWHA